jgi:hypothetical protein
LSFAQTKENRFLFHGNAVGFAAHIRRPDDFFVPTMAKSCLPVTGGVAEASEHNKCFHDIVSFESVSTRATGDFKKPKEVVAFTHGNHGDNELPTVTMVEGTLTGFKIEVRQPASTADAAPAIRKLKIDLLKARMENASNRSGSTTFHALDTEIKGASVDGHAFRVMTNPELFATHDTKKKLELAFQEKRKFHDDHGHHFFATGEGNEPGKLPQANGIVLCTVVKAIEWVNSPAPECEIDGNRLKISGIGSIYFGELLIEEDFRRLTLLRFQLGSPYGGEGSAVDVQSNGSWWPPKKTGT